MASSPGTWQQRLSDPKGAQSLAAPALLLLILGMMVVPMAPRVLDLMLTLNIASSPVVRLMRG